MHIVRVIYLEGVVGKSAMHVGERIGTPPRHCIIAYFVSVVLISIFLSKFIACIDSPG